MTRNTSIQQHLQTLAAQHQPKRRFAGKTQGDWKSWRESLQTELLTLLGPMPAKVPLHAEVLTEWREHGLIKQKVLFDVEEGLSVMGYVFRPENAKGRLPAILACHGHGPFGKEAVMGNRSLPECAANIDQLHYDYGLKMAQAGFVTMAIDWRGFGDRDDRKKPHWCSVAAGLGDLCNTHYVRYGIFGRTLLGANVHDGRCALDYLCQQDFVAPDKLGVMGLSFGGTMATWMSIGDCRIKAADIICYSDHFDNFGIRDANFCGSQVVPGLYALCDVPDLHGVIAPRPLLVEIGVHDDCFPVEGAISCFREVEKIYAAAGVRDKLELDLYEGGHIWGNHKSTAFFKKWLG